jgi:hypothetical protein
MNLNSNMYQPHICMKIFDALYQHEIGNLQSNSNLFPTRTDELSPEAAPWW